MRTGANNSNQTLTPEAASALKQSLTLARRRGHSQVTPLHVASTLLTSSRSNLFRRACLKSHPFPGLGRQISHPSLHCRALELCFNVALNRLPTNPNPLFQPQPSLSNALVAALKRAQAHQRRGCVEQQNQQNQPFLAVKVELEQLVVSILDDPSVSRVMREAGLSSVAVKNNIEDDSSVASPVFHGSSSVGVFSSPCSPSSSETNQGTLSPKPTNKFWQAHLLNHSFEQNPYFHFPKNCIFTTDPPRSGKDDVKLVIEVILGKKNNKKKNTVIVGDSVSATEGIVAELMGRIERGDVPDDLKQTHFIKFQFSPVGLNFMKKEDVEGQVNELRRKVDSLTSWGGKGVIICLGDLNWAVGDSTSSGNGASSSNYSAVDDLVKEIGKLVFDYCTSGTKVWFLGTASYQTYMRCQMRQPPLDVQWALQAVSVPSGGLGLTLHATSTHDSKMASQMLHMKPFSGKEEEEEEEEEEEKLRFCGECACNYEKEAKAFISAQHKLLPPWLQSRGDNANQKDELVRLRRKWNRFCQTLHQSKIGAAQSYPCSSLSSYAWTAGQSSCVYHPDSAASISFADSSLKQSSCTSSSVAKFRRQNSCIIEFNFGNEQESLKDHRTDREPRLDGFKKNEGGETKITLALGHSPFPSDSEKSDEEESERTMKMSSLSKKLHENLPWQREVLPSIVEALADYAQRRRDTWMLLSGNDTTGKRRLALTIAKSLFGSVDNLLQINLRKRTTAEANDCCQILATALREHENLVVLVERIDLADTQFMKLLVDGLETQKFGDLDRRVRNNGQVIFILTRDDDSTGDEDESTENKPFVIPMVLKCSQSSSSVIKLGFDHKRKSEFDSPPTMKMKNPRTGEKNNDSSNNSNASSVACDLSNIKKEFSRQLSFNTTLDLNLKADGDDEGDIKPDKTIQISSKLNKRFLDSVQNRFNFTVQNEQIREVFSTKIKNSSETILGEQERFGFSVEERLIEKLHHGCGFFQKRVFDEWVKEVFQAGLVTVKNGGKEGIGVIRLCLGGIDVINQVAVYEDGFMGTCLPKKIQVSFVD